MKKGKEEEMKKEKEEMKKKEKEGMMRGYVRASYARNPSGVMVKRCCASCRHREVWRNGQRVCVVNREFVESSFRCRKWRMARGLERLTF